MSSVLDRQRKIANLTSAKLANHDTPFIHNAWYVVSPSQEITQEPVARNILGMSIVIFRTEDGDAVAFQNRCCHRSFPLSESKVEGNNIRCGYHGLLYDPSGKCIEIPMQDKPPANIRLRSYPLREKGPLTWIWIGDPDNVDESTLPFQEWMDSPEWNTYVGYLMIKGNYVHMHENLLDLSHLSFLHENTFGTPEYAKAPQEEEITDGSFEVWRHVGCYLPPIYAKPLGWEGMKALRSSGSRFVSPGLHVNTGILKNLELPEDQQKTLPTVKVAQCLTPESQHSTHYWYCVARNFALGDKDVDEFMLGQQTAVFVEDVIAIGNIVKFQQMDQDPDFFEIDIPTDKAGVAMRRHLKALADKESAEP